MSLTRRARHLSTLSTFQHHYPLSSGANPLVPSGCVRWYARRAPAMPAVRRQRNVSLLGLPRLTTNDHNVGLVRQFLVSAVIVNVIRTSVLW